MNIREATQKWVDGFNAIPQSLIVKAYKDCIDDMQELTPMSVGDYVWSNSLQESVEILSISKGTALIQYNSLNRRVLIDDLCPDYDSWLPMWGWMWTFENSLDEDWAYNNLQEMADCGFRIYESEELGLFFGIDGAGYSFLEEHWIPLYKARGLQWHDKEETI